MTLANSLSRASRRVATNKAFNSSGLSMTVRSQWAKDFDAQLVTLTEQYQNELRPITVDFRSLVPVGAGSDRATHLMHSYPAKLLPNIPIFFLNCSKIAPPGSVVYDPFCGSGTTLVEALLSGHLPCGSDANPLARLITSAKTQVIDDKLAFSETAAIIDRLSRIEPLLFSPVVQVSRWFDQAISDEMGRLIASIQQVDDESLRTFFTVCFSSIVKRVSFADPRLSVPVVRKDNRDQTAAEPLSPTSLFCKAVNINRRRVASLPGSAAGVSLGVDARQLMPVSPDGRCKADLVITSPPYAGAQKYIRSSSLSIGWLGLAPEHKLRSLERRNIGREHLDAVERRHGAPPDLPEAQDVLDEISSINASRSDIFSMYLQEMRAAAASIAASLRSGGHLVLVMGNNKICGIDVHTSHYVRRMFENEGLELKLELVDCIKSRGLMTKRNKTAGVISHEHLFLFEKS